MTNNSLRLSKGKLFQSSTLGLNAKASARGKHKKRAKKRWKKIWSEARKTFPWKFIYCEGRRGAFLKTFLHPERLDSGCNTKCFRDRSKSRRFPRVSRQATQITVKLLALVIYLIEIDARDLLFNRAIAKIYAFQLKVLLARPRSTEGGD